jgi:hypothetical protein
MGYNDQSCNNRQRTIQSNPKIQAKTMKIKGRHYGFGTIPFGTSGRRGKGRIFYLTNTVMGGKNER